MFTGVCVAKASAPHRSFPTESLSTCLMPLPVHIWFITELFDITNKLIWKTVKSQCIKGKKRYRRTIDLQGKIEINTPTNTFSVEMKREMR